MRKFLTKIVYLKHPPYFLIFILFFSLQAQGALSCKAFFSPQPPKIEGRLVSLSITALSLDPGGLLGGVHYTEALAKSYGVPQIGVNYKDLEIRLLVEDYLKDLTVNHDVDLRISGELVERLGEPILLINRLWKAESLNYKPIKPDVLEFKQIID